jgi:hypothetical protein
MATFMGGMDWTGFMGWLRRLWVLGMVYEFFYVDDVTNSDGEWEGLWNWEWYFWDGTFGYGMGFLDGWMDMGNVNT